MNKENKKKLNKRLILKSFWQVIKRHKVLFFIVIVATIAFSALDIYIPFQYLKLWDVFSTNDFSVVSKVQHLIIFILGLNLIVWIIRRISGFSLSLFEARVIAGLREQAFSYLIDHSHAFFANSFSGSLTQKVNKYARSFEKLMDSLIFEGLPLIVRGAGTVIAIYSLFPKYALILATFCFVYLLTSFIYIRLKRNADIVASEADTKTTGAISDSISNHSSVQLFNGGDYEREKVGNVINKQKRLTARNWCLWEGLTGIQAFYSLSVEFIIFWVAVGDWRLGLITLPIMILLQTYLVRLMQNLWSFGHLVRVFYESFADAREMTSILNTPHEIQDKSVAKLEKIKGEIKFNTVSYIYENNNVHLLKDFSVTIPAGQKVAIIGSSGAGKSTFVKLLMRFFDVKDGKITIDDVDIRDISQGNLRDNVAFVPQEPVLFHRTLLENIRYGRRDATDEEVKEAAHLAHCNKFIDLLPEGYQTYVGERGIKLSGGERQRVAIARAILKNAPILVLDEATSSLDSESEALIQDALQKLIKGKTTIVVAHRLSTIRQMDRIVVIEKGEIVEDGTHEELTQKDSGIYKKLWELQAKGFKKNI